MRLIKAEAGRAVLIQPLLPEMYQGRKAAL
jgi:hypothetical protein